MQTKRGDCVVVLDGKYAGKVGFVNTVLDQIVENDRKTLDRLDNLRQYLEQSRDHVTLPIGISDFQFLLRLAEKAAL